MPILGGCIGMRRLLRHGMPHFSAIRAGQRQSTLNGRQLVIGVSGPRDANECGGDRLARMRGPGARLTGAAAEVRRTPPILRTIGGGAARSMHCETLTVIEADPERNIRPSRRHDMALVRLAGRVSQLLSGICRRPVGSSACNREYTDSALRRRSLPRLAAIHSNSGQGIGTPPVTSARRVIRVRPINSSRCSVSAGTRL